MFKCCNALTLKGTWLPEVNQVMRISWELDTYLSEGMAANPHGRGPEPRIVLSVSSLLVLATQYSNSYSEFHLLDNRGAQR